MNADGISIASACIGGGLVRLALPLAVTALVVWRLRHLDTRWEAEAERTSAGLSRPAGVPELRCWELRGCGPDERLACPAYRHPEVRCWQHFRLPNGNLSDACLDCVVFRDSPAPGSSAPRRGDLRPLQAGGP